MQDATNNTLRRQPHTPGESRTLCATRTVAGAIAASALGDDDHADVTRDLGAAIARAARLAANRHLALVAERMRGMPCALREATRS
jgi:hypothetical protein